jgi:hypothetical protein
MNSDPCRLCLSQNLIQKTIAQAGPPKSTLKEGLDARLFQHHMDTIIVIEVKGSLSVERWIQHYDMTLHPSIHPAIPPPPPPPQPQRMREGMYRVPLTILILTLSCGHHMACPIVEGVLGP